MPKIDQSRPFLPVNIAVLTISDTRTFADDKSGNTLVEMIERDGHKVVARKIVRDEKADIAAQLRAWIADAAIDVVIATGGTGVTGRDVTPRRSSRSTRKRSKDSASCSDRSVTKRSAPRRSRAAPRAASPAARICSRYPARRALAATDGTKS